MGGHSWNIEDWWEERSLPQKIAAGIGFGILFLGFVALVGLVLMLLWNWLMPDIFKLPRIDYWQAWGLLALSTILFRGNGGGDKDCDRTDRRRRRDLRRKLRAAGDAAGVDAAEGAGAEGAE